MGYKDSSPRIDAEINLNDVVVVTNAACLMLSDEGPRNSSQQKARCIHVVSRSFEHSGGESTIWLGYTQILSRTPWKGSGASHLSSSTTNLMRGFEARRLFRVPHASKALYVYKDPCLLRYSNPDPTAQQSTPLPTIPEG
ncbi:hypothetical protein TNCV_3398961 [Trichonephila clavipes]|nr:hypothetical protein TNCV_3398961 [Trichonephila clavipes]